MRLLSALALFVLAPLAVADDKPLLGSYTRKHEDLTFKITFKKDNVVDLGIDAGEVGATMVCTYKKDKDGTVNCELTKFEKKGDFPVAKEKGYKFSFKVAEKDKKIVVSDVKGDEIGDEQKKALEGEYEPAKSD